MEIHHLLVKSQPSVETEPISGAGMKTSQPSRTPYFGRKRHARVLVAEFDQFINFLLMVGCRKLQRGDHTAGAFLLLSLAILASATVVLGSIRAAKFAATGWMFAGALCLTPPPSPFKHIFHRLRNGQWSSRRDIGYNSNYASEA